MLLASPALYNKNFAVPLPQYLVKHRGDLLGHLSAYYDRQSNR